MKNQLTLPSAVATADAHAKRLKIALTRLAPLFPLSVDSLDSLTDDDFAYLDGLIFRYLKLQDVVGGSVFPGILGVLQENQDASALDRMHKLEKLDFIDNVQDWIEMRNVRNMATHDYPEKAEAICKNLAIIKDHAILLLEFWDSLREKITELPVTLEE